MNFIKTLIYNFKIKKNIRYLHIYKKKFSNHKDFIPNFLNDLEKIEMSNYIKKTFFLKFFVKSSDKFLLSSKQYFLDGLFQDKNNFKIFLSKFSNVRFGFIFFKELEDFFNINKIKFSKLRSFFLTFYYLIIQYTKSIKFIFFSLINFSNNNFYLKNYSFFVNLTKKNLPLDSQEINHTVIDWYNEVRKIKNVKIHLNEKTKKKYIKYKNLNVLISPFLFPKITFLSKIKFLVISILESFCFYLFGSRTYAFFMPEILKFLYVSMIPKKLLPLEIFFSQSDFAYKPLWTIFPEENQVKINNYFYAISMHSLMELNGNYKFQYPHKISNWPNIIFWSKYIKDDYEKNLKKINIEMSSPIGFFDNDVGNLSYDNSIVIFDVIPLRYYEKFMCMYNNEYLNYKNIKNFFFDIHKICLKLNCNIIYKPHKSLNHKRFDKRYINFIYKLNNVKILQPEVSARKLIENTNLSFAFPWTSTPEISRYLNKKAFYYDPTGELSNSHKSSLGIELINNRLILENYIKKYI